MPNLFDHLDELITSDIHPTEREEEIWARYGKRVAVMVIDSSGFSRVTEQHGILHFLCQLMIMRRLIRDVCQSHHSQDFRFEADNVYATFAHPDEAIKAALVIHEEVDRKRLMLTPAEPFRVCIGIGYGDLLHSETLEGYFGTEMNLASKLGEDTARSGETLITEAVFQHADPGLLTAFTGHRLQTAGIEATYHRHLFKP